MALQIVVYINDRPIAEATAYNVSGLSDISDYDCRSVESASEFTEFSAKPFRIRGHDRRQSCWALVEKIAKAALSTDPSGDA